MADDTGIIIGGCVAGGVVLFAVIGITVYWLSSKRKHRKKREQSKFRPISPQASPNHSQPSTLGHDGRLPKVNSTGLWVGAPSMYTGSAPSPAYYYGPGKGPMKQAPPPPQGLIARASSDPRIPQSGYPYHSSKPIYGSHGNLLMSKSQHAPSPPRRARSLPKVPVVGMQPRIYHSSQPLAPVFEVPPSERRGHEIYDVYQFSGGIGPSRSKLMETKHSQYYYENKTNYIPNSTSNNKLGRSQSDALDRSRGRIVVSRHAPPPPTKPKPAAPRVNRSSSAASSKGRAPQPSNQIHHQQHPHHRRSSSKEIKMVPARPYFSNYSGLKSKSLDSLDGVSNISFSGHYNKAFDDSTGRVSVSSLSGDIILKPAPPPPSSNVAVVARASSISSSHHYLPNGVVGRVSTTVPDRTNNTISPDDKNEIDASATDSMKLLAKNKTDDQKTVVSPTGVVLSRKDDNLNNNNNIEDKELSNSHIHYIYQGDIYSAPNKNVDNTTDNPIISRMKDMVIEKSRNNSTKSHSLSHDHNEISNTDESGGAPSPRPSSFTTTSGIQSEYQEIELAETETPDDTRTSIPQTRIETVDVHKEDISHGFYFKDEQPSKADSLNDGLDRLPDPSANMKFRDNASDVTDPDDGKKITDSAFEFLNTYLSDEESTDGRLDSRPNSP